MFKKFFLSIVFCSSSLVFAQSSELKLEGTLLQKPNFYEEIVKECQGNLECGEGPGAMALFGVSMVIDFEGNSFKESIDGNLVNKLLYFPKNVEYNPELKSVIRSGTWIESQNKIIFTATFNDNDPTITPENPKIVEFIITERSEKQIKGYWDYDLNGEISDITEFRLEKLIF